MVIVIVILIVIVLSTFALIKRPSLSKYVNSRLQFQVVLLMQNMFVAIVAVIESGLWRVHRRHTTFLKVGVWRGVSRRQSVLILCYF
jgi:hypothetical protein